MGSWTVLSPSAVVIDMYSSTASAAVGKRRQHSGLRVRLTQTIVGANLAENGIQHIRGQPYGAPPRPRAPRAGWRVKP